MIPLGQKPPDDPANPWRQQLDCFVRANQKALAAIAWGLRQEWGDTDEVLGIDLRPTPHFICCDRADLEILNERVDGQIQEILGVLDGCDPATEVAIVAIGKGQLKLIHYQPEMPPHACFQQLDRDLGEAIAILESKMGKTVSLQSQEAG
jgi:hypothetical protein